MTARICLLSPAPIWVNPRLVKEADALHEAGYDVVAGYRADGPTDRDDAILTGKAWRWHRIDVARERHPFAWMRSAVRQRAAEGIVRAGVRSARAERAAYCRGDAVLTRWAAAQHAALYIAHTQPVLAVAAAAASARGVPFAFDCEDLLAEEAADGGRAPWRQRMITHIERRFLPRAAYVSATSAPMAEYLSGRYGLRTTRVWHNCFPAAAAAALRGPADRPAPTGPVELAWISATVGPGRGLEDIFAAVPKLGGRVALRSVWRGGLRPDRVARQATRAGPRTLAGGDASIAAGRRDAHGARAASDRLVARWRCDAEPQPDRQQQVFPVPAGGPRLHRHRHPGSPIGLCVRRWVWRHVPARGCPIAGGASRNIDQACGAGGRAAGRVDRRPDDIRLGARETAIPRHGGWRARRYTVGEAENDAGRAPVLGVLMAERRCIIVAPHFPPSGLPPAHRARLFVRHLGAYEWTPIVVTVDPRDREEPAEPELLATVPAGVRVELVRALPARVTRIAGIGDLVLRSLRSLAVRTIRVARETSDPVVLLVVPPWYALWLAPLVRKSTGARVVVDYVDPWRIAATGTVKSRVARWMATRTEGGCLRAVDGLFAVSDAIIADVRSRFPWTSAMPAGAAPYGFEEADRSLLLPDHAVARSGDSGDGRRDFRSGGEDTCCLVYIGALSDAQLPVLAALLDAVVLLRSERPAVAARLRIELYGTTYAAPGMAVARTAALVAARGLESVVAEHPVRVPYVRALTLADSSGANLVLGDTTAYYAASKLMPVLAARRPVVAIVHAATEPAALLRRLGCRGLVCYGTADTPSPGTAVRDIASALNELIQGTLPAMTADFTTDAALQSRTAARMTEALAAVLGQVAAGASTMDSSAGSGRDRPTA